MHAVGVFSGAVTDAAGNATSGMQRVTVPVDSALIQASCEILDLVLGPLDLNLLEADRVAAEPGSLFRTDTEAGQASWWASRLGPLRGMAVSWDS